MSAIASMPVMIDARAVAELLSCSHRHVFNLDADGRIPKSTKLGALRRWNAAEIERWLNCGCQGS